MSWRNEARLSRWFSAGELPTLCIRLRQSITGAADPMGEQDEQDLVDYVKARLIEWTQSKRQVEEEMDAAVKQLCFAAIRFRALYRNKQQP